MRWPPCEIAPSLGKAALISGETGLNQDSIAPLNSLSRVFQQVIPSFTVYMELACPAFLYIQ